MNFETKINKQRHVENNILNLKIVQISEGDKLFTSENIIPPLFLQWCFQMDNAEGRV